MQQNEFFYRRSQSYVTTTLPVSRVGRRIKNTQRGTYQSVVMLKISVLLPKTFSNLLEESSTDTPGRASKRKNMLSKTTRILSFDSLVVLEFAAVNIKMNASKTRQTMQQTVNIINLYLLKPLRGLTITSSPIEILLVRSIVVVIVVIETPTEE